MGQREGWRGGEGGVAEMKGKHMGCGGPHSVRKTKGLSGKNNKKRHSTQSEGLESKLVCVVPFLQLPKCPFALDPFLFT